MIRIVSTGDFHACFLGWWISVTNKSGLRKFGPVHSLVLSSCYFVPIGITSSFSGGGKGVFIGEIQTSLPLMYFLNKNKFCLQKSGRF